MICPAVYEECVPAGCVVNPIRDRLVRAGSVQVMNGTGGHGRGDPDVIRLLRAVVPP